MPSRPDPEIDRTSAPTSHRSSDKHKEPIPFPLLPLSHLEKLSDEELAAALNAGTADALTVLFERHSTIVFSIARRMLRDPGEAEEALQQVFLDVYKAIGQFDSQKASFRTWLIQYAYHRTLNRKRLLNSNGFYTKEELDEDQLGSQIYAGSSQRMFQMFSPELVHLVGQLLDNIEPRQRKVIELTYFEGLSADEIAKKNGETVNVVRHNLYRGLNKIRLALREKAKVIQEREVKEIEGIFFAQPRSL